MCHTNLHEPPSVRHPPSAIRRRQGFNGKTFVWDLIQAALGEAYAYAGISIAGQTLEERMVAMVANADVSFIEEENITDAI